MRALIKEISTRFRVALLALRGQPIIYRTHIAPDWDDQTIAKLNILGAPAVSVSGIAGMNIIRCAFMRSDWPKSDVFSVADLERFFKKPEVANAD